MNAGLRTSCVLSSLESTEQAGSEVAAATDGQDQEEQEDLVHQRGCPF